MTRKRNPKDTNATESFQIFGWHLSGLRLVILGAIGGVILTVAGNVATAAYSEWRTSINEQLAAARQAGRQAKIMRRLATYRDVQANLFQLKMMGLRMM